MTSFFLLLQKNKSSGKVWRIGQHQQQRGRPLPHHEDLQRRSVQHRPIRHCPARHQPVRHRPVQRRDRLPGLYHQEGLCRRPFKHRCHRSGNQSRAFEHRDLLSERDDLRPRSSEPWCGCSGLHDQGLGTRARICGRQPENLLVASPRPLQRRNHLSGHEPDPRTEARQGSVGGLPDEHSARLTFSLIPTLQPLFWSNYFSLYFDWII